MTPDIHALSCLRCDMGAKQLVGVGYLAQLASFSIPTSETALGHSKLA
jgi:hypothetical protein